MQLACQPFFNYKPAGNKFHSCPQLDQTTTLFPKMKTILIFFTFLISVYAQGPGVSIFEQSRNGIRDEENKISKQAEKLFQNGKLLGLEATGELIKSPAAIKLELPVAHKNALTPSQVAERAKVSGYRVGWAYLCNSCDNWHINLAGGYAITDNGILGTCSHVINMDNKKMRKGGLIAVDHSGKVYPVTSILANDKKIDGALIKIDAKTTHLPLNDQIAPGDSAFCLSRPLKQGQYFSQGIVNRFYWNNDKRGDDPNSIKALGMLKLNVSSRWAPGSSGSAVLDTFGNAIGHVATISTMDNGASRKNNEKGRTLITLHSATPARAMMALARLPEDLD